MNIINKIKSFFFQEGGTIRYAGTRFTSKVEKCECGKKATQVSAHAYFGDDIMNKKTGDTYLECDFSFHCNEHGYKFPNES